MNRRPDTYYGYGAPQDADYPAFGEPSALRDTARRQMEDFTEEMRSIEEAQARGQHVPDEKLLGFLSVPAPVGAAMRTIINPSIMMAASWAHDHSAELMDKHGSKLPMLNSPGRLAVAKRGVALTLGLAPQLAEHVVALGGNFRTYKKNLSEMAKEAAPVLTDIKGGHGITSLLKVGPEDNEVLYAQRRRIGDAHGRSHMLNMIAMIDKVPGVIDIAGKQLAMGHKEAGAHWSTKLVGKDSKLTGAMSVASGAMAPLSTFYQRSLKTQDARENGRATAYDMIVSLAQQMRDNPGMDEYEVPGARNVQLTLPQYIAATFKCHQVDMAKLDEGSRPIRQKLEGELLAVSNVIADAITKGEITPLSLMQLVGKRQIVRGGGASVVQPEEAERVIKRYAGKGQSYTQVDEKRFFDNFSKQDIKDALTHLKGDERLFFMATLPDNILRAEGVKDKEIKEMRDKTGGKYRDMLAQAVVGLGEKDDDALKALGLAEQEISELRRAAGDVVEHGKDAIDQHRTSATNANGIESVAQEIMINSAKNGGKASFASFAKGGREVLARVTEGRAQGEQQAFAERLADQRADMDESLGR